MPETFDRGGFDRGQSMAIPSVTRPGQSWVRILGGWILAVFGALVRVHAADLPRIDGEPDEWGIHPMVYDGVGDSRGGSGSDLLHMSLTDDGVNLYVVLTVGGGPNLGPGHLTYSVAANAEADYYNRQVTVWGENDEPTGSVLYRWESRESDPMASAATGLEAAAGSVIELKIPFALLGGVPTYAVWIKASSGDFSTGATLDELQYQYRAGAGMRICHPARENSGRPRAGGPEEGAGRESVGEAAAVAADPGRAGAAGAAAPPGATPPSGASGKGAAESVPASTGSDPLAPGRIRLPGVLRIGDFSEYRLRGGSSVRWSVVGLDAEGIWVENRQTSETGTSRVLRFLADPQGKVLRAWAGPPGGPGAPIGIDGGLAAWPEPERRQGPDHTLETLLEVKESLRVAGGAFTCRRVATLLRDSATGARTPWRTAWYAEGVRYPIVAGPPESPGGAVLILDAEGAAILELTVNGSDATSELSIR